MREWPRATRGRRESSAGRSGRTSALARHVQPGTMKILTNPMRVVDDERRWATQTDLRSENEKETPIKTTGEREKTRIKRSGKRLSRAAGQHDRRTNPRYGRRGP